MHREGEKDLNSATSTDNQYRDVYLNINLLDALNFIMSLFYASTCFIRYSAVVVSRCFVFVCYYEALLVFNTVQGITNIIEDYQDRVRELPYVPTTSFTRDSL